MRTVTEDSDALAKKHQQAVLEAQETQAHVIQVKQQVAQLHREAAAN